MPFPLPPLAEQKRIVAKVDELMALCDALEAQQKEREAKRSALAKASLAAFAEAPSSTSLELLFHPSYAIVPDDLRKSILTLAVQGKLVEQDGGDEVSIPPTGIAPDANFFEIPSRWRWVEYGRIANISGGFAFKSSDYAASGVFVLRVTNIESSGDINRREAVYLRPDAVTSEIEKFYLNAGEILLVMVGGSLGKLGVVPPEVLPALLNQNLWRILPVSQDVVAKPFLKLITKFSLMWNSHITKSTHGHLSREEFRTRLVPLPPLAEQKRIVAKVDELMALVDRLEAKLVASREVASRLMEAMVAELAGRAA